MIRFGAGVLAEAPKLLAAEGFDGYVLLTTARALGSTAGAARLAEEAEAVLEVPGERSPRRRGRFTPMSVADRSSRSAAAG